MSETVHNEGLRSQIEQYEAIIEGTLIVDAWSAIFPDGARSIIRTVPRHPNQTDIDPSDPVANGADFEDIKGIDDVRYEGPITIEQAQDFLAAINQ